MVAELTRLTHKIAIQLHLLAESCTICSSRSRWPVRKFLDTLCYSHSAAIISANLHRTFLRNIPVRNYLNPATKPSKPLKPQLLQQPSSRFTSLGGGVYRTAQYQESMMGKEVPVYYEWGVAAEKERPVCSEIFIQEEHHLSWQNSSCELPPLFGQHLIAPFLLPVAP
jgi:hypothetical protein